MKTKLPLLTFFALTSLGVQGGLITSPPAGSTTTLFATGSGCGGSVDAGFTISGGACTNNSQIYLFGTNGAWNNPPAGFGLIGADSATSSIIINLGGLYSAVGGFVNYDTPIAGGGSSSSSINTENSVPADPLIIALAADGTTVLDSYDINVLDPINTPGGSNAGAFVGIQDATNDIGFLELSFDFLSIHSITIGTAGTPPTPEPSSVLLLGSGLALLCASRRRWLR